MLKVVRNLLSCVCLLLVLAFLFSATPTHAADLNASVGINPSLTLTLPTSDLNLSLNPATTTFGYKDLPISISTNNETGYIMTVTTANDSTDLVNTSDSNIVLETLPAKTGGYTDSDFIVNKWGYKNGLSNNYTPFTSGATVLENSTYTNEDSTTLRFASKIDYMQEEGTYSTTFSFNLVVNPVYVTMQDLDPILCTATPREVIDERDDKIYTIARLADGQCWMTSNLNLTGGTVLNASDSNVPTDNYYTLPASSPTGFISNTTAYVYNSGNETTNQADCYADHPCNSYYSWLAATAGGKDANGNAVTSNGYNAAYSICPKGWRLPTITTSNSGAESGSNWKTGEFYKLATAYGANLESDFNENTATFYNNAGPGTTANFLITGWYYDSALKNGDTMSFYWSSTSYSSTGADTFAIWQSGGRVGVGGHNGREVGEQVRCVLDDTMQNLTNQDVRWMEIGEVRTLRDTRDNQTYAVAKLADGRAWMIQNLKLGQATSTLNLTTTDSDVQATGFTLNGKLSNGVFTYSTIGGVTHQNNSSQYYCTIDYGCYYNWYTSTAGSGSSTTTSGDVGYSICPKGWTLPTSAQFVALSAAYSDSPTTILVNPTTLKENINGTSVPGLLLGGYYNNSNGARDVGTRGGYWSRTAYTAQFVYSMSIDTSSITPATNTGYKYLGVPIRCLLKQP